MRAAPGCRSPVLRPIPQPRRPRAAAEPGRAGLGGGAPLGLCPTGAPREAAGTREDPGPGTRDASTGFGAQPPLGGSGVAEGGRPIDRRRGPGPGRGRHRSGSPAAPLADGGASWQHAPHRAGDAGISGSNWAGRRRGTSAPRGCRGPSLPQLGLSV